jgi:hypothetical protein
MARLAGHFARRSSALRRFQRVACVSGRLTSGRQAFEFTVAVDSETDRRFATYNNAPWLHHAAIAVCTGHQAGA